MKFVILTVLVIIAAAIAAPQGGKIIAVAVASQEATCSPWLKLCHVHEDCCRHLTCLSYAAKCIPKSGLIVPGADKRPLGPGPYSPNVPKSELPN